MLEKSAPRCATGIDLVQDGSGTAGVSCLGGGFLLELKGPDVSLPDLIRLSLHGFFQSLLRLYPFPLEVDSARRQGKFYGVADG